MTRQRLIVAIIDRFGPQTYSDLLARIGCTRTDLTKALDALTDAQAVAVILRGRKQAAYALRQNAS